MSSPPLNGGRRVARPRHEFESRREALNVDVVALDLDRHARPCERYSLDLQPLHPFRKQWSEPGLSVWHPWIEPKNRPQAKKRRSRCPCLGWARRRVPNRHGHLASVKAAENLG